MSWTLVTTDSFERRARKFLRKHPELKERLAQVLKQLNHDPFAAALRLHPLSGKLKGLQAVSLTFSYRITLSLQITEQEIRLLDIGAHDQVYR